jgi:hypothetical protein
MTRLKWVFVVGQYFIIYTEVSRPKQGIEGSGAYLFVSVRFELIEITA